MPSTMLGALSRVMPATGPSPTRGGNFSGGFGTPPFPGAVPVGTGGAYDPRTGTSGPIIWGPPSNTPTHAGSLPLSPQQLTGVRLPGVPPATPGMFGNYGVGAVPANPDNTTHGDPNKLTGLRPGGNSPSIPNPYRGNPNPGNYTTPAPFNPLLAQTILGRLGQLHTYSPGPLMPRGPLGSFGLTPEKQRPKGANPYR